MRAAWLSLWLTCLGCDAGSKQSGDLAVMLDLRMGGADLRGHADDAAGASVGDGSSGARWIPSAGATFFWQLASPPTDNSKNVGAYDIDGFDNSTTEVDALHALGKKVVCYMDAGTWEPGRPDAAQFPSALLGSDVVGWPGEKWLDIRPAGAHYAELQAILSARFALCAQKGFDAVEPDNLDSYQNSAGFSATAADQLSFNRWIASTVHGLGLSVLQKNDLDQSPDLVNDFDGILDEECNKYSECGALAPYLSAGKPAWNAEYTDDGGSIGAFCAADVAAGIAGALFSLSLDGSVFQPCASDAGAKF